MSQAMVGNAPIVPNVTGAPIAGQNAAPPTPQSQKPSGGAGSDSQNNDTDSSKSGRHPKRTKRTKKTKRRSTSANSPPRPKKSQDDDTSSVSSHGRAVDESDFDYEGENDSSDDERQRNKYRRKPNSLPMKEFNFGDKAADWTSWIKKFENIVFAAEEPSTREEHHKSNIKWLPAYLNTLAHDIFVNCKNRKNWTKLKRELEDAFDDPEVKQK